MNKGRPFSVTVSSYVRLNYSTESYGFVFPKWLWTNIEPDFGIIYACLPTMMPLIRLVREKFKFKSTLPRVYFESNLTTQVAMAAW